jgi:hypothetical protein
MVWLSIVRAMWHQPEARPQNPRCPGIGVDSPDPGQIEISGIPKPPIPAKSGFPKSRIPEILPDRGQIGIQIPGENPRLKFSYNGQNRDCTLPAAAGPARIIV